MEKYYEEDEARRLGIPYKTKAQLFLEHLSKSSTTQPKPLSPDAARWKPLSEVLPVVQERVENKTDEWSEFLPSVINKASPEELEQEKALNDRKFTMLADRGASALEGLNSAFDGMYKAPETNPANQFRMPGLTDVEPKEQIIGDTEQSKPIDLKRQFINKYAARPQMGDANLAKLLGLEAEQMDRLVQGQNKSELMANLFDAASRAGAAIAGVKYDPSAAQGLQKTSQGQYERALSQLANAKSQRAEISKDASDRMEKRQAELNLQNLEELNNPNSQLSQLFKQSLSKMGLELPEGMSPAQVLKGLPIIQQAAAAETKSSLQEQRQKERKEVLDLKKTEADNTFIEKTQNQIEKSFSTYNKVREAKANIESAIQRIKEKGTLTGPEDVGVLYQFIKGFDPESVVKEGEIDLAKSAEPLVKKWKVAVDSLTSGALMSDKYRNSILKIMEDLHSKAQESYKTKLSPRIELAKSRGIDEDRIKRELDIGRVFYPQESTKPGKSISNDERSQKNLDTFLKNNPGYSKDEAVEFLKSKGMYR